MTVLFTKALRSKRFLEANNLVLKDVTGPPSGLSTTVKFTYEIVAGDTDETAKKRHPLWDLVGIGKTVFGELGGGENFIKSERAKLSAAWGSGGGEMILRQIKSTLKPEATIPGTDYVVKAYGKRRGEDALVYRIPNSRDPKKPAEKGINESEWQRAYGQLMQAGEFTRKWFNDALPECAAGQPCNFTVIGNVFVLLGIANENGRGNYTRQATRESRRTRDTESR